MSNIPGAPMSMPAAAVETGANPDSGTSGIEKSVEAAISSGNAPALVQAGTQLTQATTQRITSIAAADPNEADMPEQGVISAIAGQANGLAQEAHRKYVNSISAILQAQEPSPSVGGYLPLKGEPTSDSLLPIKGKEPEDGFEAQVVTPPATMPGFEPRPEPPAPTLVGTTETVAPPMIEVQPIAIAAQVYLDERDEMDKVLNAAQANYEGHSIKSAVPYYEAVLAQDPSDQQWQTFVVALKMEYAFYNTKRERADLALRVNQLQNEIEDNRKHNILPTAEQAETLKHLQQAFDKANADVSKLEQEKAKAEEQYHSTQA